MLDNAFILLVYLGSNFFEICRYFFKIASNCADTAVNVLRTFDAFLLRIEVGCCYFSTINRCSRPYLTKKKRRYICFSTDAEERTQPGNQISAEGKQTTLKCFCCRTEAIIYRNLLPTRISDTVEQIQFDTKQTDVQFYHLQLYFWE